MHMIRHDYTITTTKPLAVKEDERIPDQIRQWLAAKHARAMTSIQFDKEPPRLFTFKRFTNPLRNGLVSNAPFGFSQALNQAVYRKPGFALFRP